MDARGHEEIARAFGARRGENGRREFVEACALHAAAHGVHHVDAQHDVLVQALATQVEEAIFQAGLFGIVLIAEDRQGQLRRLAQHFDLGHIDLDLAGRHVGVLGSGRAGAHLAVEPHDPFGAQGLGGGEGGRVRINDALGHAVMVAQVDEQHAAVVADAVAPAGEADVLADEGCGGLGAGMGAVAMHGGLGDSRWRRARVEACVGENADRGKLADACAAAPFARSCGMGPSGAACGEQNLGGRTWRWGFSERGFWRLSRLR